MRVAAISVQSSKITVERSTKGVFHRFSTIGAGVVLCCLGALSCDHSAVYSLPLQPGEVLNENAAVRLSAHAIRQAGHDPEDFELFPIRETGSADERYFGTSHTDPPHGYVMWKMKRPDGQRLGLTVSIELRERMALCKVAWWH
jgi:hypothetical protein